jgi:protein disulfide-isomerase A6
MKSLFMIATLLSALSGVSGMDLTKDNFEDSIQGKNAFVKFFAPWCGHCKSMKPAWDELAEIYSASSSVLIGDVDCTADESKDLCEGTSFPLPHKRFGGCVFLVFSHNALVAENRF